MAPSSTVQSSMHFLKRDPLYDSVKPYESRRKDWTHMPKTNAMLEEEDVTIQDIRGTHLSLATHGFSCMNLETELSPEDFQQPSKVAAVYLPQLAQAVKASLGADRIQIYDFTVCLSPRHGLKLIAHSAASDILTIPTLKTLKTFARPDSRPTRRTLVILP